MTYGTIATTYDIITTTYDTITTTYGIITKRIMNETKRAWNFEGITVLNFKKKHVELVETDGFVREQCWQNSIYVRL